MHFLFVASPLRTGKQSRIDGNHRTYRDEHCATPAIGLACQRPTYTIVEAGR